MPSEMIKTPFEPTVLVVDGNPLVRKRIEEILQRAHLRVITASNGLDTLTSMADETPDVVILNTQLPRMDGYQICSIIRKNLRFSQIPILMHSDKEGLLDKVRGRLAGATDYLTSPFDSGELIETVKKYLRNGPEAML